MTMKQLSAENRNNSTANSLANSCEELINDRKRVSVPMRFIIVLLCFFSTVLMFILRSNISVAIVAMVNHTAIELHSDNSNLNASENINEEDKCPGVEDELEGGHQFNGEFNWNENIQGHVLGSYYYGYAFSQILGGRIAERFGAKWPVLFGLLIQMITSLLTPLAASCGPLYLVFCRILMGIFNGSIFASFYTLFAVWIPKTERATSLAITVTGCNVGSAISMVITAFLCEQNFVGGPGWPLAFYVPSLIGFVWVVFWIMLVTNNPEENRFVSEKELKYIKRNVDYVPKKITTIPWKSVIMSIPMWSIILAKCGGVFSYIVLAAKLPSYLEGVLRMDMTKNGLVNALLYVATTITCPIGGRLSDYVRKKEIISLTLIRKIFQTIAYLGPISLALIPIAGCNQNLVIVLVILSMSTLGFETGGLIPAISDIAPAISATIFGVSNTFSSSVGFIAPLVIGWMLGETPNSRKSWNRIFYLSSGLSALGILIFIIFGTAKPQPWGVSSSEIDESADDKENNPVKEKPKEINQTFNEIKVIKNEK